MSKPHKDMVEAFGCDPWMMIMGCEVTKLMDHYLELPDDKTIYDENFNQREPLRIKDKKFCTRLDDFIDQ